MPRRPGHSVAHLRGWLLTLTLCGVILGAPPAPAQTPEQPRVIVLGFDGADAVLTQQYMDAGHLPNLARLRDQGTFAPLGTTTPPQTPVSWSSFATGTNPGKTGIFDFLRRDLKTYQPDFAMYVISSNPFLLGKRNHLLVAGGLLVLAVVLGLIVGGLARRPARGLTVGLVSGLALAAVGFIAAKDLLPYTMPEVENTRQGEAFWETAGRAGLRSRIVRVPATWPPSAVDHGRLLSGLGVPDIRGTFGTFSYYTTEPMMEESPDTEFGGKIIEVSLLNGETTTEIFGPRNRLFDEPKEILIPLTVKVDRSATPPTVTLTTSGQTQTIPLGGWSDWVELEFPFNSLIKAYGLARFYFRSSEPFGLYMSSINMDPHRPALPISAPESESGVLAERFGTYKTLGWALDTWALNELRIDEATFLEDVYFTEGRYREMMLELLDDADYDLFVQCYELTDRVAHLFWRLLDTEHPMYDAALAAEYGDAVLDSYKFMDAVVGEAMERLRPDDLLLICSDHGFHTWHKSVNYNTWLVRNGFMALKSDADDPTKTLEDLFGQGEFWPNVDWSRTKAYALGLGNVYINVKGRESKGIVEPGEEYERIRDQVIAGLTAWQDPDNGEHPVRRVVRREEVYNGFDPDLIPDLFASNNPKYRVSWQTSLGGIPREEFVPNLRKWSGDHCSLDPEITKGILFSNKRLAADKASITDLCPTILDYLGVPVPEAVDGVVLARP